ncbi:MAG TPA: metallopeptidase TldD-related protein, partial [Polyangia bacterium]|nr:metallopeptidase TldD-related protein [Polyangia bacterium]
MSSPHVFARRCLAVLFCAGCASPSSFPRSSTAAQSTPAPPGALVAGPRVVAVAPAIGGGAPKPDGLAALEDELHRAMTALGAEGKPPPYFIAYEVNDRTETVVSASYGALVQSTERRARTLDTDVRVGDYKLDSTHIIRSDGLDFSSAFGGRGAALPLTDDPAALRAVAWIETDRRYKEAAERLVKIKTQRTLKVADEDASDDFSREKPVVYLGPEAAVGVDIPAWEKRLRALSARFRGQGEILDSQVTLQVVALTRWMLNSEGSVIQTAGTFVRVFLQADAHADDGMELERFESFDAATFDALGSEEQMNRAADAMIADLKALRNAPLADPYIGPAILEGKAAGVFFHEIFGHRVEGHRQKNDDEGQTFAKKIGEPVMPSFISVYDDPTLARIGNLDLNGFYHFDDEAVPAQRVPLVDG